MGSSPPAAQPTHPYRPAPRPLPSPFLAGALGCVVPELLDGTNHIAWFKAGAEIFGDDGIQYLGIPGLINAKSIVATLIVQVRSWADWIQQLSCFRCCTGAVHWLVS